MRYLEWSNSWKMQEDGDRGGGEMGSCFTDIEFQFHKRRKVLEIC